MSTKAKWLELAERCEKATGPDREIDRDISKAVGDGASLTPYTASLDAITALIEREFPNIIWRSNRIAQYFINFGNPRYCGQIRYRHQRKDHEWAEYVEALQDTPALALCAAFCRAMAGKAGT